MDKRKSCFSPRQSRKNIQLCAFHHHRWKMTNRYCWWTLQRLLWSCWGTKTTPISIFGCTLCSFWPVVAAIFIEKKLFFLLRLASLDFARFDPVATSSIQPNSFSTHCVLYKKREETHSCSLFFFLCLIWRHAVISWILSTVADTFQGRYEVLYTVWYTI